jgi:uncharacterized protein
MLKKIALKMIEFYQKFISPHLCSSCKFQPTCSTYTHQSIEEWGLCKGILLGLWRILRCNPFSKGGIDNVPKKKKDT